MYIDSFYIKGQSSGTVDIRMFDTNDELITSCETSAARGGFRKINVESEWFLLHLHRELWLHKIKLLNIE